MARARGVLRQAIIHELNYKYKHFQYQDASFQEYGYGGNASDHQINRQRL